MALPKGWVRHISDAGRSQHPPLGICPSVGSKPAEAASSVAEAQAVTSEQDTRRESSRRAGR